MRRVLARIVRTRTIVIRRNVRRAGLYTKTLINELNNHLLQENDLINFSCFFRSTWKMYLKGQISFFEFVEC